MAEDAYFRDLLRIPKQEKWVDFCLQYRQRHYMLLKMPLYLDLDAFQSIKCDLARPWVRGALKKNLDARGDSYVVETLKKVK